MAPKTEGKRRIADWSGDIRGALALNDIRQVRGITLRAEAQLGNGSYAQTRQSLQVAAAELTSALRLVRELEEDHGGQSTPVGFYREMRGEIASDA